VKGYFQSNCGRWRTSGRPTTPDQVAVARCGRRGRSSPELHTTRLWCSIFGGFSPYGTSGVRGTHQGGLLPTGDSGAGCAVVRFKLQHSVTVGDAPRVGSWQGWAKRCDAGCRTPTSGWWSSRSVVHGVAMKGANLGFASVFFEIPAQRPSIYRGFRLIILCTCRALSPSFPIRREFDFDQFPLRFWSVTALLARFAIRRGVGDDPLLGRSWAACERSRGRLGWAARGGFRPMANRKMKKAFYFSIFFSKF
jgi:hypothetical protein